MALIDGMTGKQILMDLHARLNTLEATVERYSAQLMLERRETLEERVQTRKLLRQMFDHTLRLVRKNETLFEMIGRLTLEQSLDVPADRVPPPKVPDPWADPQAQADLRRFLSESAPRKI